MDPFRPRRRPAGPYSAAALILVIASAAQAAQARACVAQVDVHDRASNSTLPVYHKRGRHWVAGEPGHEYELRIRNCADVRVLAVISVDGVNVITGQSAAPAQSGYVLEPGEHLTVEGWRKSLERTAAFVFTDPADSFAARTGRPDDLGVIGVALFRERSPAVVALEPPAIAERQADAPAAAESAAGAKSDVAGAQRAASLGTGHGRSEHSPAQWTHFERASQHPDETIRIRYETRATLVALGVLPGERTRDREPDPFPAALGFVPDP
jgi:hypothetical protein